jgi:hypothetical protein
MRSPGLGCATGASIAAAGGLLARALGAGAVVALGAGAALCGVVALGAGAALCGVVALGAGASMACECAACGLLAGPGALFAIGAAATATGGPLAGARGAATLEAGELSLARARTATVVGVLPVRLARLLPCMPCGSGMPLARVGALAGAGALRAGWLGGALRDETGSRVEEGAAPNGSLRVDGRVGEEDGAPETRVSGAGSSSPSLIVAPRFAGLLGAGLLGVGLLEAGLLEAGLLEAGLLEAERPEAGEPLGPAGMGPDAPLRGAPASVRVLRGSERTLSSESHRDGSGRPSSRLPERRWVPVVPAPSSGSGLSSILFMPGVLSTGGGSSHSEGGTRASATLALAADGGRDKERERPG